MNFTLPSVGSIRRRMQRPVVVFPQPLSPTSPSTSPAWTSKLTPSTALTCPTVRESSPFLIGKCFFRPSTRSSGSATSASARVHRQRLSGIDRAGGDLVGAPAARQMAPVEGQDRRILPAAILRDRTAGMEPAALRKASRVGNVAGDDAQRLGLGPELGQ